MKTRNTVEETGLKNHLGDEKYNIFIDRLKLRVPMKYIANEIGYSEKWTRHLRDIYHKELQKHI